jgi:hypothetical protein
LSKKDKQKFDKLLDRVLAFNPTPQKPKKKEKKKKRE